MININAVDNTSYSGYYQVYIMPEPPKLLDQMRNLMRLKHLSYKTERAYVGYIREYILFHNKKHPNEMGVDEIRDYLTTWPSSEKAATPAVIPQKCYSSRSIQHCFLTPDKPDYYNRASFIIAFQTVTAATKDTAIANANNSGTTFSH